MSRALSMTLAGLLLAATAALAAGPRDEMQAPRAPDEIQAPASSGGVEAPRWAEGV